jgi:hypothetical protein
MSWARHVTPMENGWKWEDDIKIEIGITGGLL